MTFNCGMSLNIMLIDIRPFGIPARSYRKRNQYFNQSSQSLSRPKLFFINASTEAYPNNFLSSRAGSGGSFFVLSLANGCMGNHQASICPVIIFEKHAHGPKPETFAAHGHDQLNSKQMKEGRDKINGIENVEIRQKAPHTIKLSTNGGEGNV